MSLQRGKLPPNAIVVMDTRLSTKEKGTQDLIKEAGRELLFLILVPSNVNGRKQRLYEEKHNKTQIRAIQIENFI